MRGRTTSAWAPLGVIFGLLSSLLGCGAPRSQSVPSRATDSSGLYESTGELSVAHVPHDGSEALVWEWVLDIEEGDAFDAQEEPRGELRLLELNLERRSRTILWRGPAQFCPTRRDTEVHSDLRVAHVGNDIDPESSNPRTSVVVWDASAPDKPHVQVSGWVDGMGVQPRWRSQGDAVCYIFMVWGDSSYRGPCQLVALPVPRPAIPAAGQVLSPKETMVYDFAWSPDGRQLYVSCYSQQKYSIDIIEYPGRTTKQFTLPAAAFKLSVAQDSGDVFFAVHPPSENGPDDESEVTDIWQLSPGGQPGQVMSVPRKSLHAMSVSPDGTLIAVIPHDEEGRREMGVGVSVFSLADGTSHPLPGFESRPVASADWVLQGRGLLILDGSRAWLVPAASIVQRAQGE